MQRTCACPDRRTSQRTSLRLCNSVDLDAALDRSGTPALRRRLAAWRRRHAKKMPSDNLARDPKVLNGADEHVE